MDGLRAGIKNELLLMLYRKKTLMFFIISAFIPLLLVLLFQSLHLRINVISIDGLHLL